jgi:hypothetical protein
MDNFMGIVKLSDAMHENLRVVSNALCRSINAQAEHWLRVGMVAELYPELNHKDICKLLISMEQSGGFDLNKLSISAGVDHLNAATTQAGAKR